MTRSSRGAAVRTVRETAPSGSLPLYQHPGWRDELPWLVQGVTGRGREEEPFDLAFFGAGGGGDAVWERWRRLMAVTGSDRLVQGRQVHRAGLRFHRGGDPGVLLVADTDGHATAEAGLLLSVTVADCVPVSLVAPGGPAVALLHAGWRGVAAGILEAGVSLLEEELGVFPDSLLFHAGPAVCGDCYEVGPEVHRALGLPEPAGPEPVDLRALLVERALGLGLREEAVTVSEWCTLCGESPFFSHRGGDDERQAAILGIRPPDAEP